MVDSTKPIQPSGRIPSGDLSVYTASDNETAKRYSCVNGPIIGGESVNVTPAGTPSGMPPRRSRKSRRSSSRGVRIAVISVASLLMVVLIAVGAVALFGSNQQSKTATSKPSQMIRESQGRASDKKEDVVSTMAAPKVDVDKKGDSIVSKLTQSGGTALRGKTVLVDPGHSGGSIPGHNVPDGRGGFKVCNNSGTATNDGYPEHTFNWDVAQRLKAKLEAAGAKVVMTRNNDSAAGPCVDERGKMSAQADVVVSIHANGTTNPAVKGYFALVSSPPLNEAQGQPSVDLAQSIMSALAAQGFAASPNYPQGLMKRSDIAGLNFSVKPAVMMELGEMRNPEEAAVMKTEAGRERYAVALFNGLADWAKTH
ncbi:MAG: N-acetylmuramoyl-L-alanine amidase [Actinomycetaceae bacterium]|nr:N-acetylmuramoyl-L-alanine amidase [Actinomycetaceae bacterium]